MTHEPGTVLIHPSHGPMRVVSTTLLRFPNGTIHECMNLETIDAHALTVTIPIERFQVSGMRHVVTGDAADELFKTLGDPTVEVSDNWSRRFKANEQKMHSGSVLMLAEVVRDLLRRDEEKHLSLGERRALTQGMSQLAREVFYSKGLSSVEAAEVLITAAALSGDSTR